MSDHGSIIRFIEGISERIRELGYSSEVRTPEQGPGREILIGNDTVMRLYWEDMNDNFDHVSDFAIMIPLFNLENSLFRQALSHRIRHQPINLFIDWPVILDKAVARELNEVAYEIEGRLRRDGIDRMQVRADFYTEMARKLEPGYLMVNPFLPRLRVEGNLPFAKLLADGLEDYKRNVSIARQAVDEYMNAWKLNPDEMINRMKTTRYRLPFL